MDKEKLLNFLAGNDALQLDYGPTCQNYSAENTGDGIEITCRPIDDDEESATIPDEAIEKATISKGSIAVEDDKCATRLITVYSFSTVQPKRELLE